MLRRAMAAGAVSIDVAYYLYLAFKRDLAGIASADENEYG